MRGQELASGFLVHFSLASAQEFREVPEPGLIHKEFKREGSLELEREKGS